MARVARLITRRLWLTASISAPIGWSLASTNLLVRHENDVLRISAPQLRFLTGKSLERLKNGANVAFISQLSLSTDSALLSRQEGRFVVSYDLWEEKFSATRVGPPMQSISRLSMPAAEAWCLEQLMRIPNTLTPAKPFWIKLELRAEDPKESAAIVGEPGINLTRLVEVFSRPPRSQQQSWTEKAGPYRLQDL